MYALEPLCSVAHLLLACNRRHILCAQVSALRTLFHYIVHECVDMAGQLEVLTSSVCD